MSAQDGGIHSFIFFQQIFVENVLCIKLQGPGEQKIGKPLPIRRFRSSWVRVTNKDRNVIY